jgi:pyruvate/2-oxoglutarate dehydrogenase complex dihydrolipoamide acyltransferase (E2) component
VKEFRLPDIGEGLAEAEIVKWHVPVGGVVAVDQTVVEVETDKAVVEIPSPFAGRVIHHGAGEGEVVRVGEVLVVIGDDEEVWAPPAVPPAPAPVPAAAPAAAPREHPAPAIAPEALPASAAPIVGTLSEQAVDLTPATAAGGLGTATGRVSALPRVRKLAAESGLDLASVAGTGPGGRVTEADVAAASGTSGADASTRGDAGSGERRPLSKLRRTIAANLSRSWSEIPHVTAFDEVDATRLLAVRTALQARHDRPIPIDALLVAAVAPALEAFPEFNASLDGDVLVLHPRLDIGIAVDGPEGLVVATVRDVGGKSVVALADEVRSLGERGKSRSLTPAELSGQTFTVSNIGAVAGGGHGTPLVPFGTVGILSVGRATDRPVARAGRVEIAPVMPLSLSYDHRVVDGAGGRRFLRMVVENLAEPALFLAG